MEDINIDDLSHIEKLQLAFDDITELGSGYDDFVKKLLDSSSPEQYDKGLQVINEIESNDVSQMMINVIKLVIIKSDNTDDYKNQLIELTPKYVYCRQLLSRVDFKSIKKTDIESDTIEDIHIEI